MYYIHYIIETYFSPLSARQKNKILP